MKFVQIAVVFGLAFVLGACGSDGDKNGENGGGDSKEGIFASEMKAATADKIDGYYERAAEQQGVTVTIRAKIDGNKITAALKCENGQATGYDQDQTSITDKTQTTFKLGGNLSLKAKAGNQECELNPKKGEEFEVNGLYLLVPGSYLEKIGDL